MATDVFRKLRKQLDNYAFGYPETKSGVEMEILKLMFTEEEAVMFTQMTAELETPEAIAQRINQPVCEIAARLEDMAGKGLLFRRRTEDIVEYCTNPFLHGLYEFQITRLGKKLVKLTGQYINEVYKHNMAQGMRPFIRTIPIDDSIASENYVTPYEDAKKILKDADLIVVTKCACRQGLSLFGMDCGQPQEVCFMFGPMGQYYIDNGWGRKVELSEALAILEMANKAGLITQAATSKKPFDLCNCCVDCCGFLRAVSKTENPAELVFSNYRITVDRDKCTGCGTCEKRCGMGAVAMNAADGKADLNLRRCIGCGLCVTTCPVKARALTPKEGKPGIPYEDTAEQFMQIVKGRGVKEVLPENVISFGFQRNVQAENKLETKK
ncbi:MAG: NADH-dependent phenylglyoxylate dehydrogenase subunit delta [Smithella sp. PtaU1.Bin162]|nr:MAG: NADH-dependent phenylglyoxylate dehydrogenase subunit delta [Smithella sp. PtaU1.Bin162]